MKCLFSNEGYPKSKKVIFFIGNKNYTSRHCYVVSYFYSIIIKNFESEYNEKYSIQY